MLVIICAWCKKTIGEKDGKGATGFTHSICPECKAEVMEELNPQQKES